MNQKRKLAVLALLLVRPPAWWESLTPGIDGIPDTWPGILQVSDIRIDGSRFSFIGVGSKGWSTSQGGVRTDHCCPRLAFAGTINGDSMTLTMTWTSTENPNDPTAQPLPMEAKRLQ